jgi:Rieske Fe-S protein
MHAMPSNAPETPDRNISRRRFLEAAWKIPFLVSAAAVVGGIVRFLSFETDPPAPTRFVLGPVDEIPIGGSAVYPEARAVVLRDLQGYFARSLVCPHLGCTVEQVEGGFHCPCHGSRYGSQGQLVNGPAQAPLHPVLLEWDDAGALVVDIAVEVDPAARLAEGG